MRRCGSFAVVVVEQLLGVKRLIRVYVLRSVKVVHGRLGGRARVDTAELSQRRDRAIFPLDQAKVVALPFLPANLAHVLPIAVARIEDQEVRKRVLAIIHASCHIDQVVAERNGEVFAADDRILIVVDRLQARPLQASRVESVHLWSADFYPRIDSLQRYLTGERVQLVQA